MYRKPTGRAIIVILVIPPRCMVRFFRRFPRARGLDFEVDSRTFSRAPSMQLVVPVSASPDECRNSMHVVIGCILRLLDSGYLCTRLSTRLHRISRIFDTKMDRKHFLVPHASGSHVSVSASREEYKKN